MPVREVLAALPRTPVPGGFAFRPVLDFGEELMEPVQGFGEQLNVERREAAAGVRPVIDAQIVDRKVDHLALAGHRVPHVAARAGIAADQRGEIRTVDAEDDIGLAADRVGRRAVAAVQVLRMGGGDAHDVGPVLVGGAQQLDQPDQRRARVRAAAEAAAEDKRHGCFGQKVGGRRDFGLRRGDGRRRPVSRQTDIGERRRVVQPVLLETSVDRDVGRALRGALGDPPRAQDGVEHRPERHRLVGPFGVGPHRLALGIGGMEPVDGAAFGGIGRSRPAQHEDRNLVRPGVVKRHHGVLQPDQIVENHEARLAGDLAVALRHVERDFLCPAEDDLGPRVPGVIDQRIVEAPEARTGGKHHMLEPHRLEQVAYQVGTVFGLRPVPRQVDRNLRSETLCLLVHTRLLVRHAVSVAARPGTAKPGTLPI